MPPRPAQEGGSARGGRGGGGGRGRGAGRPPRAAHVRTVGVRRPGFGTAGRKINVFTNAVEATIPDCIIYHYDTILPEDKVLPIRLTMQLIKQLQVEPEFHPAGAYDGRKNLFMSHRINFEGGTDSREYNVAMNGNSQPRDKPPRVYKIRIAKANEINAEVLHRYVNGQQSQDESVLTTLTALNVVIRATPIQNNPFNTRSFFTSTEIKEVGHGFQLWRGYFQSLRPSQGRLLINIDLSTGMFHKPGPLIPVALEVLGQNRPESLSPSSGLPERIIKVLEKYLRHVRVTVQSAAREAGARPLTIDSLTRVGAQDYRFTLRDNTETNVAAYFQRMSNRPLQFPRIICAKMTTGAIIPLERCTILPGQLARKEVPPDVTRQMVEFSTKRPEERLASIKRSVGVFSYGQSEYVRNFGLAVNEQTLPITIDARQLAPPRLEYGQGSKEKVLSCLNCFRSREKKLFTPQVVNRWAMVIFESENRFRTDVALGVVRDFIAGCRSVGIDVRETDPVIEYGSGQNDVKQVLRGAGGKCAQKHKKGPDMLLVILPEGGNDIYRAVKHFGDITQGVVTQCLKAGKCRGAREQYWANVCLKLNPKLGGINVVPDADASKILYDPQNPTIVFGADVMHPAPGSDAPSFSAVVGSIDSRAVKYVPRIRVQRSRLEIIANLGEMVKSILEMYLSYQRDAEKKTPQQCTPKRLLFFRDGVSEGQFEEVMQKAVCRELKIAPKITFVVVGKRHHYRFFPKDSNSKQEADRSGNCLAGTVVDRGITHPLEFDFYLQSHGGLLGTSRSAHYSVYLILFQDNKFSADAMQNICYYLCYYYARATRSVSIPAPVYYADIVCSRARIHYDPSGVDLSDTASAASTDLQSGFLPLNPYHLTKMYFMVSRI
ncbi:hypothetical protein GYMLUDRAFT_163093 [Collybiopsis luxurians FD-317 M1]|uniref:Piwi domain-containing protein n=1 Tax=Collybiopsis luxurians FD-317 M1 TaxID=944289 RepID=A0A0D0CKM5_9AGAR|nr:hypothetical protein GYMLUDRAFT_163093 [Collybiopsis luxurians FD-317 M1]